MRDEQPLAFHVMVKPRGPICNLNCTYCFYLDKKTLFPPTASFYMPDEVLEEFTRQYIEAQETAAVNFGWQGGEPTLMGLDFFRKALDFQEKYHRPGMRILNSLQTNGILIDNEWCNFLSDNKFLVGLSIDGPEELHDVFRLTKGKKSSFASVIRAMKLMQRHRVEFNVICVVNSINVHHPLKVYKFFKEQGVKFVQFIPAVGQKQDGKVTDWTVGSNDYGQFLCAIFDEWVHRDVGRIFVQSFDVALGAWLKMETSLCISAKTCGRALAMEFNGDLYSCDHFVSKEYFLGNIMNTPMLELVSAPFQRKFGIDKYATLPKYCQKCPVCFACNGACPKDRFLTTPDGEPGLNYLCEGYKRFFTHIDPVMRIMADELRKTIDTGAGGKL